MSRRRKLREIEARLAELTRRAQKLSKFLFFWNISTALTWLCFGSWMRAIMDMVIAVNFFVLWQREKQVAEDRLNLRTEGVKAAIEVLRRPDEWRQPWL